MTDELIDKVMKKIVPAKKPQLYDLNMKAIQLGFNYEA